LTVFKLSLDSSLPEYLLMKYRMVILHLNKLHLLKVFSLYILKEYSKWPCNLKKNHRLIFYFNLKNLEVNLKFLLKLNLVNDHLLFINLVDYIFFKFLLLILNFFLVKLNLLFFQIDLPDYRYQTNYSFCTHHYM